MGLIEDYTSLLADKQDGVWCRIQPTAVEGILVLGARVVGNLYTAASIVCILKQIYVGALIESVMARLDLFSRIKVVNVTKAGSQRVVLAEGQRA